MKAEYASFNERDDPHGTARATLVCVRRHLPRLSQLFGSWRETVPGSLGCRPHQYAGRAENGAGDVEIQSTSRTAAELMREPEAKKENTPGEARPHQPACFQANLSGQTAAR